MKLLIDTKVQTFRYGFLSSFWRCRPTEINKKGYAVYDELLKACIDYNETWARIGMT